MKNISQIIEQDVNNGLNVRDDLKQKTVEEIVSIQQASSFPYAICLISVTGDLNIGVAIRSALLHGAERVFVFGRRKFDNRSLVGAQNYIEIKKVEGFMPNSDELSFDKFTNMIDGYNYTPVFCETGGTPLQNYKWNVERPILVFGAEGTGIPEHFMVGRDIVTIPQQGVLRSFNVSAAASMCMWDLRMKKEWF